MASCVAGSSSISRRLHHPFRGRSRRSTTSSARHASPAAATATLHAAADPSTKAAAPAAPAADMPPRDSGSSLLLQPLAASLPASHAARRRTGEGGRSQTPHVVPRHAVSGPARTQRRWLRGAEGTRGAGGRRRVRAAPGRRCTGGLDRAPRAGTRARMGRSRRTRSGRRLEAERGASERQPVAPPL